MLNSNCGASLFQFSTYEDLCEKDVVVGIETV